MTDTPARPGEEGRIEQLSDFSGPPGHSPILLISSVLEIGFSWDSEQEGWIRVGLPPLRMVSGSLQHFRSAVFSGLARQIYCRSLQE